MTKSNFRTQLEYILRILNSYFETLFGTGKSNVDIGYYSVLRNSNLSERSSIILNLARLMS